MPFNQVNHTLAYRPLIGGVVVYNPANQVEGTLGFIAQGANELWLVSAFHVMGRRAGAASAPVHAEPVLQPFDASPHAPPVAFLDLNLSHAGLDVAFARVAPGVACEGRVLGIGTLSSETLPQPGMRVLKSGIATGVTEGVVTGVDLAAGLVTIGVPPGFPVKYDLTADRDSGSVWVDAQTLAPVALHLRGSAGGVDVAFGLPIRPVLENRGLTTLV